MEARDGQGPSLHTHPYAEVHIVQEGEIAIHANGHFVTEWLSDA